MPQADVQDIARAVLQDQPEAFLELVAREVNISPEHFPEVRERLQIIHGHLHQIFLDKLREILKAVHLDIVVLGHPGADHALIAEVKQHFLHRLTQKEAFSVSPLPLTPELRQWALGHNTDEEIVAGLQEARAQNGPEFKEIIREIEREFQSSE